MSALFAKQTEKLTWFVSWAFAKGKALGLGADISDDRLFWVVNVDCRVRIWPHWLDPWPRW